MIETRKRIWVLLPMAIMANDSFWELWRGVKFISEHNGYIYLLEMLLSSIYFVLCARWDNTIKFFYDFEKNHPCAYKIMINSMKLTNHLVICILHALNYITTAMSASENNHDMDIAEGRKRADEQKKEQLELLVYNSKTWVIVAFFLGVCFILLWTLFEYHVLKDNVLKYIACVSNLFIIALSVIFIVKGYMEKELKTRECE